MLCAKRFSQREVGGVYREMKKALAKAQRVSERGREEASLIMQKFCREETNHPCSCEVLP